jgi:hypothetical protein
MDAPLKPRDRRTELPDSRSSCRGDRAVVGRGYDLVRGDARSQFLLPSTIGTFTIADAQNWIALFAFLAVSLVTNNLSSIAGARTKEALARRDELGPLFDLSRDVLLITDSQEANARRAVSISTTRRSASLTHPVGPSFKRARELSLSEGVALFALLARNVDRVLTHQTILTAIWSANAVEHPEHLWVLVAQLRKKIEPDPSIPRYRYLISEPWVGYRFSSSPPE